MDTEATWTLEQLGERVKDALASGYVAPGSARVRAVPDARTIRYYSTLGIVDRPALAGRTALYGERHLLQLVAIKRLQADGLTLTQVQERLAGLPTDGLRALARVAPAVSQAAPAAVSDAPRGRADFWRAVPVAPSNVTKPRDATSHTFAPPAPDVTALVAVELAPGCTLVLRDGRRPDADDVHALRLAAGPLLAALEARGFLQDLEESAP